MLSIEKTIFKLQDYWKNKGCLVLQPYDMEMGAGTFHQATFLKSIGPEPWSSCYVQASRRPSDGRYGNNTNRLQHYYQFQVVIKPSPIEMLDWYLESLLNLGVDPIKNEIKLLEDNWESPSLGAWGIGWEVWINGIEVSQITYFQEVASIKCLPVTGELTYGLERLVMAISKKNSVMDILWNDSGVTYQELFKQNEFELSKYNFEDANIDLMESQFSVYEEECKKIIDKNMSIPAYECLLKCSQIFNIIESRGKITSTERGRYISRLRKLASNIGKIYYETRKSMRFPLLHK